MVELNPYSLAFRGEQELLELEYRKTHFNRYLNHFRLCSIASIVFLLSWSYAEFIIYPEFFELYLKIKMATIIPMFVLVFLFTYHRLYQKYSEPVLLITVIMVGTFFNVCIAVSKPPDIDPLIYGIIITYIFNYTFIRSRFITASISGWFIYFVTIFVLLSIDSSLSSLTTQGVLLFLGMLNVLGMIISYTVEYSSRREFYLEVQLTEKRDLQKQLNLELSSHIEKIKILKGMIPICAKCKKIRDDSGYWKQVEVYIAEHTDAVFTHGLCEECQIDMFPEIFGPDE